MKTACAFVVTAVTALSVVATLLVLFSHYLVWSQSMVGKATLARAEQEKQIQIEQAKAEVESARLRAQAIELIGEAAKKYPEYRHQEFIGAFGEALREGNISQVIYVPTEANIPITEAHSRRPH